MGTNGHTIGLQSFIKFPYFVLELQRGTLCAPPLPPPGIQTPKKSRGNRVKHKLFLFVSITPYKFLNNLILSGHIFVFQYIVIMIILYWLLTIKKKEFLELLTFLVFCNTYQEDVFSMFLKQFSQNLVFDVMLRYELSDIFLQIIDINLQYLLNYSI